MLRTLPLVLVVPLGLVACRSRDDSPPAPRVTTPAATESGESTTGMFGGKRGTEKSGLVARGTASPMTGDRVPVWNGACARVVLDLQLELARLPSKCTQDKDCVCYVGGVSGVTNCGGTSDRATSTRVAALTEDFQKADCNDVVACAARLCTPTCNAGVCSEH